MLKTNTKAEVGYTPVLMSQDGEDPPEWRVGTAATQTIPNPAPVELRDWAVYIRKVWLDSGTEHDGIGSITLQLKQDGQNYGDPIVLTREGEWYKGTFQVAPGLMVSQTEENSAWGRAVTYQGQPYVLLNEGHSYSFEELEPVGDGDYTFQLAEEAFYPMLVGDESVEQVVALRNGDAFTNEGRLPTELQAKNRLANAIGIEITKQVLDAAGLPVVPQDAGGTDILFHLRVTLATRDGDLSAFPQEGGDRVVRFSVLDRNGRNVTAERYTENYLAFNAEGVAAGGFAIGAGETLLFPNVPENTVYLVEEPEEEMPEGFVCKEISDSRPAEDGMHPVHAEGENRTVVVNQIPPEEEAPLPRIVIDKFQTGDNSQKLSGAAFVLYRFPSQEELDADPDLSAGTPLYYTRAADSEPPEFQPDQALALTATTDADGRAEFPDLSDGVYYLLETEAPVDYRKLVAPIAVTVDTSWLAELEHPTAAQMLAASIFVVHVANSPESTLPAAGGPGVPASAALSLLLLAALGLALLPKTRRGDGSFV